MGLWPEQFGSEFILTGLRWRDKPTLQTANMLLDFRWGGGRFLFHRCHNTRLRIECKYVVSRARLILFRSPPRPTPP